MNYTDWMPGQPNGGRSENCATTNMGREKTIALREWIWDGKCTKEVIVSFMLIVSFGIFQHVLPCLLENLPMFTLRGLCYNGVGIDEEFVLTMDEETGQTVFFGKTYSTIRFNRQIISLSIVPNF